MRQVGSVALVAVVVLLVAAAAGAAGPSKARDVTCAVPRRTRIASLIVERVSCRVGRQVAAAHERSLQRRGACRSKTVVCWIGAFACVPRPPRPGVETIFCASRRSQKIVFRYRPSRR